MPSYYTSRTTYAPARIGDMDAGYDAWMDEDGEEEEDLDLELEDDEEEEDGEEDEED